MEGRKKKLCTITFTACLVLLLMFTGCESTNTASSRSHSNKIVFSSHLEEKGCHLYAINTDGSNLIPITNGEGEDFNPEWSPDRTKIVFDSDRQDNTDIYVMNADGTGEVRLTDNPASDVGPSWSPDGKKIVFSSYRATPENGEPVSELYVMNADSSELLRLTYLNGRSILPDWSPDGEKIVFCANFDGGVQKGLDIYCIDADRQNIVQLTDNAFGLDSFSPEFSPDGEKIVFCSEIDGPNRGIYIMNADGSNQVRISDPDIYEQAPSWSPDGSRIVLLSGREYSRDKPYLQIYCMDADGTNQIMITDIQGSIFSPDW